MDEKIKLLGRNGACSVVMLQDVLAQFRSTVKPEDQACYLSLYGPVGGSQPLVDEAQREGSFTDEDARLAVKVFSVLQLNAWKDGVYRDSSRMSHSCAPNCCAGKVGDRFAVHALRAIEAGEELTVSYGSEEVSLQPTFQRRRRYITKLFTCHCPRCDAPGDDTRQFECERPGCSGHHLVRYPVEAGPPFPEVQNLKYTGVQYEDPHLLPCNVCKHPASPDFEGRSLEIERQLPALADALATKREAMQEGSIPPDFDMLRDMLDSVKYPKRHVYGEQMLETELFLSVAQMYVKWAVGYVSLAGEIEQSTIDAMNDLVRLYDGVLGPHNLKTAEVRVKVADSVLEDGHLSLESLCTVRNMLQAAVRSALVQDGREHLSESRSVFKDCLLGVMEKIADWDGSDGSSPEKSAAPGEPTCAFCGESPTRAAMSERCCPGCGGANGGRGTMYCSEACRKAHWPLHRKHCRG